MQRTFTVPEQTWVTALLEDAAAHMRGVMRNQVYPPKQSTYTAYPVRGRVNLPQSFVTSIDAVQQAGADVTWTRQQDSIFVNYDLPTDITFSYGLASPPADLIPINCALVSQQILTVEAGLGLNAGGLSSIALDDFKAAFADAGASTGLVLTPYAKAYLENTYGTTGWVVETK